MCNQELKKKIETIWNIHVLAQNCTVAVLNDFVQKMEGLLAVKSVKPVLAFLGFCKQDMLQLREYQKDLEYRLHHRLSKFDIPNIKANF